jgi:hypothetical protein
MEGLGPLGYYIEVGLQGEAETECESCRNT